MSNHCVIIARGGSKGLRNKNIIKINGKPLIEYTIMESLNNKLIKEIWVSSDSKKILKIAKNLGCQIIKRPSKYSSDRSTSESAWLHAIKHIKKIDNNLNILIAPQVTSPIRKKGTFDNAIRLFKKKKYDSMLSVYKNDPINIWNKKNKKIPLRKRRQDQKKIIIENGSFYIFKTDKFTKIKNRFFGNIGFYIMTRYESFEIDSLEDLKLIKKII
jgi:CMP-N,N'-diacetyllegionaminic acid synthase